MIEHRKVVQYREAPKLRANHNGWRRSITPTLIHNGSRPLWTKPAVRYRYTFCSHVDDVAMVARKPKARTTGLCATTVEPVIASMTIPQAYRGVCQYEGNCRCRAMIVVAIWQKYTISWSARTVLCAALRRRGPVNDEESHRRRRSLRRSRVHTRTSSPSHPPPSRRCLRPCHNGVGRRKWKLPVLPTVLLFERRRGASCIFDDDADTGIGRKATTTRSGFPPRRRTRHVE
mmetsp:Transcript_29030/g.32562  ORF Transcript_29030/g.32562 Transcript_29030/m.32562 type:complete len:231 (+) Transcript_29030:979-1671(+)